MNLSDARQRQLHGVLLPNSTYGQGTSSRACLQNGFSSIDGKARRKMIDLQLPADEYLDMDENGEITISPPYKRSKSGRGDDASSHRSNSSGSCLDVKNSNGLLADLNEPLICQDSEPVSLSRDVRSYYGRHNADVQGKWLEKNTSQNGWMVLDAGHGRSTQRDMNLPSHSLQVRSSNAVQHQRQSYRATDRSSVTFSRERAYRELEVRSRNPQASYDSYVESSVASTAPRLHNDCHPDNLRPWRHCSSSWENPRSRSHQKSYPVQTNPFMSFFTHEREDSSFKMRSNVVSNGIYHEFSSGSKEAAFKPNASLGEVVKHQSFESLQVVKRQESSAGLPWLKPKPTYKSEVSNGFFDLNASTSQSMGGTDAKSLRSSASCSNMANTIRVEKHSICKEEHTSFISHSLCIADQHKEVNHLVKRDIDINLPCDALVSVDQQGAKAFCVKREEGNKAANIRHYFDLNTCASEDGEDSVLHSSLRVETKGTFWIDLEAPPTLESEEEEEESSQEKTNEETWRLMKGQDGNSLDELIKVAAEAILTISLSDHPDDAASSSTDVASKCPLSWFADIITSCGDELEREIDGSPEYSSEKIDYFEAMTLSLHPTKEQDYMPEPLVPENLILEGTGLNRPRRGQARRGRPKRDFQRDTLPGLSSLSRHEVTEDIQLFGALMETREDTSVASARRNSKRMNESVSVVGVEDSKLTGWGKATRRPRRGRCPPAGNPATVILT